MTAHPENLAMVLAKLEPDASFAGSAWDASFTPERCAALSTAISLRRIADFLCGSVSNCDAVDYLVGELRR